MRTRFRTGRWGKLILQVEHIITWEAYRDEDGDRIPAGSRAEWRDAKVKDFPHLLNVRIGESL